MLLRSLGRLAMAATAALLPALQPSPVLAASDPDAPAGQSTFISPGGEVAFALTINENHLTDIYFSLRVSTKVSWGAVGLGSSGMPGALFLIVYRSADDESKVVFSPRLGYGYYEPKYTDSVKYETLNGTGVKGDYMYFNAKCTKGCRSWPAKGGSGGYIDVSTHASPAIFAFGPKQGYYCSEHDCPLKLHEGYGQFTIDMKRTEGSADLPALVEDSKAEGTELKFSGKSKSDWKAPIHGAFMIFAMLGLYPLGVALLRLGGSVRWHALNQVVATVFVFMGFAFGVWTSTYYQRSRNFNSAHQVIGILVVAALFGQFALGFLHHKKYKQTQTPTTFGQAHLWLGRAILFFGVFNGFMGFTLAVNRGYGMTLAALIIVVCLAAVAIMFARKYMNRHNKGQQPGAPRQGYNSEPWRAQPVPHTASYPHEPPPGYDAAATSSRENIGLRSVSPSPSPWQSSSARDKEDDEPDLGGVQRPREFT